MTSAATTGHLSATHAALPTASRSPSSWPTTDDVARMMSIVGSTYPFLSVAERERIKTFLTHTETALTDKIEWTSGNLSRPRHHACTMRLVTVSAASDLADGIREALEELPLTCSQPRVLVRIDRSQDSGALHAHILPVGSEKEKQAAAHSHTSAPRAATADDVIATYPFLDAVERATLRAMLSLPILAATPQRWLPDDSHRKWDNNAAFAPNTVIDNTIPLITSIAHAQYASPSTARHVTLVAMLPRVAHTGELVIYFDANHADHA